MLDTLHSSALSVEGMTMTHTHTHTHTQRERERERERNGYYITGYCQSPVENL